MQNIQLDELLKKADIGKESLKSKLAEILVSKENVAIYGSQVPLNMISLGVNDGIFDQPKRMLAIHSDGSNPTLLRLVAIASQGSYDLGFEIGEKLKKVRSNPWEAGAALEYVLYEFLLFSKGPEVAEDYKLRNAKTLWGPLNN